MLLIRKKDYQIVENHKLVKLNKLVNVVPEYKILIAA